MKFKLKLLIAAALLLALAGCGIISIGYNYAEAYLRYSINSYATFDDRQKDFISAQVNTLMSWHRREMLPEYAAFLGELQRQVVSGKALQKEDVTRYRLEVRALYVKTLAPAIPPAAKLLHEMSSEQIAEMVQKFERDNTKQKDKELSGSRDEQLRKRAERSIDFLENLTGGFSDRQLEQIREMSLRLPYATHLYIAQREFNQAMLLDLLNQHKDEAVLADFLNDWLNRPAEKWGTDERDTMQAFEAASDEMIASVYQMLSEKQKKTLLKNIEKYMKTFLDLAIQQ